MPVGGDCFGWVRHTCSTWAPNTPRQTTSGALLSVGELAATWACRSRRSTTGAPAVSDLLPDSSFPNLVAYWREDLELVNASPSARCNGMSGMCGYWCCLRSEASRCARSASSAVITSLKQLAAQSYNRAKQARIVLRLAVRHEVLPRNLLDHVSRLCGLTSTQNQSAQRSCSGGRTPDLQLQVRRTARWDDREPPWRANHQAGLPEDGEFLPNGSNPIVHRGGCAATPDALGRPVVRRALQSSRCPVVPADTPAPRGSPWWQRYRKFPGPLVPPNSGRDGAVWGGSWLGKISPTMYPKPNEARPARIRTDSRHE